MNYRLILITHGDAPQLDRVIEAFAEHVSPAPRSRIVVVDGAEESRLPPVEQLGGWEAVVFGEQRGFCSACQAGWAEAVAADEDYIFWLENDFVITRDVDLSALAEVLELYPELAQMQLMRDAVNQEERAAGGLYESRPGQYDSRLATLIDRPPGDMLHTWLQHRAYLTTNPSLMRRAFMEENPWPAYPSECEGRFGIDLVQAGYSFGVWGEGDPWCEHVGVRTGFGY